MTCYGCCNSNAATVRVIQIRPLAPAVSGAVRYGTADLAAQAEDGPEAVAVLADVAGEVSVAWVAAVAPEAGEITLNFENTDIQEGVFGVYNGQTAFIEDLIRQIVGITQSGSRFFFDLDDDRVVRLGLELDEPARLTATPELSSRCAFRKTPVTSK